MVAGQEDKAKPTNKQVDHTRWRLPAEDPELGRCLMQDSTNWMLLGCITLGTLAISVGAYIGSTRVGDPSWLWPLRITAGVFAFFFVAMIIGAAVERITTTAIYENGFVWSGGAGPRVRKYKLSSGAAIRDINIVRRFYNGVYMGTNVTLTATSPEHRKKWEMTFTVQETGESLKEKSIVRFLVARPDEFPWVRFLDSAM